MAFYPEFAQHPSKPHQCIWTNEEGIRCRSYAMRNQYTGYHHQTADMPEVMSNDPFPLPRADNFENIQMAVAEILERIAENRMDPKRASALLNGLQIASSNLHRRNSIAATAARLPQSLPGHCHPERSDEPASPTPEPCHPERSDEPASPTAEPCHPEQSEGPGSACHSDPEGNEGEESPYFASHPTTTFADQQEAGSTPPQWAEGRR